MWSITVRPAVVAVLAALATAAPAWAAGPASFADPPGDAGTAPDISGVTVGDAGGGRVTLTVAFANATAGPPDVMVVVDADDNSTTGDTDNVGAEYVLALWGGDGADSGRWSGTKWVPGNVPSLKASFGSGVVSFEFDPRDLGSSGRFSFWVRADWPDAEDYDDAPDRGSWAYRPEAPAATAAGPASQAPAQARVTLSAVGSDLPAVAKAGGVYRAVLLVTRSDTGGFVGSEGAVACKATVAGRSVTGSGMFVTTTVKGSKVSAAVCEWRVPASARKRTLTGSIVVGYERSQVTRRFTARVA